MGVLVIDEDTRIRAQCSNEICRHCHNENNINVDQKHRRDIPRHQVQQTSKRRYRCDGCSISSRIIFPIAENAARCCYLVLLKNKNSHPRAERAMHHGCPVCFEVDIINMVCVLAFRSIP
ncbi:E3 ubiquitin-protein like [Actinidia chinensis var. chinensis]|uniref:E3 ubiquitin-protein like n=1 Tax=Actinidia chinensis var. chinensis TaxID=1590841 RepID=A0A2R6QZJ1_ACTCC|nr:E3 ubiquitin-protein like [Actinidia chinensis var. chinensis]